MGSKVLFRVVFDRIPKEPKSYAFSLNKRSVTLSPVVDSVFTFGKHSSSAGNLYKGPFPRG